MAKFLSEATNWIKRSISDAEDVQEDNSNGSGIRKQASTKNILVLINILLTL